MKSTTPASCDTLTYTPYHVEECLTMDKPHVADHRPAVMTLEPGNYAWCQCGLSKNQPFCDGAHAGTSFQPVRFTVEQTEPIPLCNCKATNKAPRCDGTHSTLSS